MSPPSTRHAAALLVRDARRDAHVGVLAPHLFLRLRGRTTRGCDDATARFATTHAVEMSPRASISGMSK